MLVVVRPLQTTCIASASSQELDHVALCSRGWGWHLSMVLQQPKELSFGQLLKAPHFGCLQDFWTHEICDAQAASRQC